MMINDTSLICPGIFTSSFYKTWIDQNRTGTNHNPPGTRQELTRTTQDQPGCAYSFPRVIFYEFFYTSRSIIFAYLTGIKEDFILLIWGVCHIRRTPWLLVTIFICKCVGVQIGIWKSSKAPNTWILIGSAQFYVILAVRGGFWLVLAGSCFIIYSSRILSFK